MAAGFVALSSSEYITILGLHHFQFSAAFVAGCLFAFSTLVWEYSISAEVFALNNVIISAMVYLTLLYFTIVKEKRPTGSIREGLILSMGSFLSALALTNQHASIIHLAIIVPFVLMLAIQRRSLNPINVVAILVAFTAGLSPYYYLVFASANPQRGSWGDMTTPVGLVKHFLRSEYGTFRLGIKQGNETAIERIWMYAKFASTESYHAGFPLLCFGFMWLYKEYFAVEKENLLIRKSKEARRRKTAADENLAEKVNHVKANAPIIFCLVLVWVFYVLFWHIVLSNLPLSAPMPYAVHARFWMQPNIVFTVLASAGVAAVLDWVTQYVTVDRVSNGHGVDTSKSSLSLSSFSISGTLQMLLVSVFLSFVLQDRFALMDKSVEGWVLHNYSDFILESLPQNSMYITHTDLDWNSAR